MWLFRKKSNLPQVVLATDVYTPLPANNLLQQPYLISNQYTSWRMTTLFVNPNVTDLQQLQDNNHIIDIRNTMNTITTYINNHGGWTAIRWMKKGTIVDSNANDSNAEEVAIDQDLVPHFSYLYPTDINITTTPEFAAMQLNG